VKFRRHSFKVFPMITLVFFLAITVSYIAKSLEEIPYIDKYYTKITDPKVTTNETAILKIRLYNPINETFSVIIRINIFDGSVDCFPSNESVILLSPSNYLASSKETEFVLIPHKAGSYPIEIQLWWNDTYVDSKILTLEVQEKTPPLEPDIWWSWVRFNIIIWGLIYLAIFVRFLDPSWEIIIEEEGNVKWIIFASISIAFFIAFFFFITVLNEYNFIHWFVSSLNETTNILSIAWGLGIISLGASLFKKFKWANTFSNFIFIFLLLSLVWDWLLFPQPPYPQWSPILILIFTAFLNVLLEMGIKGIIDRLKSVRKS